MNEIATEEVKQPTVHPYVCNVINNDGTTGALVGGAYDAPSAVAIGCTCATAFQKPITVRDVRDTADIEIAHIGQPKE